MVFSQLLQSHPWRELLKKQVQLCGMCPCCSCNPHLCLGDLPEDMKAEWWRESSLPCSVHLPRAWRIAGVQQILEWTSGWIDAVNLQCIWSSLLSSQMERIWFPEEARKWSQVPFQIPDREGLESSPPDHSFCPAILSWNLGPALLNLVTKISDHWIL